MITSKKLTSANASIEQIDDGILKLSFTRPGITLTKKEVMCGWQLAIDFDPKRRSKILLVTAEGSLLDKAARKDAFEEKEKWPKVAMIIHDTGQVLMAKIAITRHTPSSNTKTFTNEKDALLWLHQET